MKERVISGVVIAALIVGAGLLGGFPLAVLIMVCSMIGFQELARATSVLESTQKVNTLTGFALVMTAVYYAGLIVFQARWGAAPDQMVLASDFFTTVIIIAAFLGTMSVYVLTFPKFRSEQVMAAFFQFCLFPGPDGICVQDKNASLRHFHVRAHFCLQFCLRYLCAGSRYDVRET